MSHHPKPFHYEDIPARGPAERYRVGDANDDVVVSFETEVEAQQFVRNANADAFRNIPPSWRF